MDFLAFRDNDTPPKLITEDSQRNFDDQSENAAISLLLEDEIFAEKGERTYQPTPGNELALFGEENIGTYLNKIYMTPQEIDAGFITEDKSYEISIFSLYREEKEVSNVNKISFGGADLQHPVTPFNIPANSTIINDLTVYGAGPPFQNSQAVYVLEPSVGYNLTLDISGRRILPFLYEPDFKDVEEGFSFETIIYKDERAQEQRRTLAADRFRVELSFPVLEEGVMAQKLQNDLVRFGKGVLGVPIFSECLHLVLNPQGSMKIETREDFSYFYLLKNVSDFVLLKSLVDDSISEIKEISSLDEENQEINVASNVSNSFPPSSCVCYPVLIAYVDSYEISRPTSNVLNVRFDFKEYV